MGLSATLICSGAVIRRFTPTRVVALCGRSQVSITADPKAAFDLLAFFDGLGERVLSHHDTNMLARASVRSGWIAD